MSQPPPYQASPPGAQEGHRVQPTVPSIPDHEVIRQIGSGSYGSVWLAKSMTGAWRAVKIVRREDFDDDRTFNREFEGILHYEPIARNHPGLVHILHVGRKDTPNPFYYYVMELADDAHSGDNINPAEYVPRTLQTDKKLAGDKPLPLDYCLEVGSQLAHALLYLHSKGLTHRDIKPSNVIFVNSRPKLADIGLVAHYDQRSFVGTEGFIPPEGPGSQRADIYALAKVLYEVTTGKDRLDFPELPDNMPDGALKKKWLSFNNIICAAAEPRAEEATITTANAMAEAIDTLRGFSVTPRFRFPKRKKKLSSNVKITLSALVGAVSAALITFWASSLFDHPAGQGVETPPAPVSPDQPAPPPRTPVDANGYVLITSTPARASIYDAEGRYVDETPYGPVMMPAGQDLKYTLKKEGYADLEQNGVIEGGKTLALGGPLKPYHPPIEGQIWKDTMGVSYIPEGVLHVSEDPVLFSNLKTFLDKEGSRLDRSSQVKAESMPPSPDSTNPPYALTTRYCITHFTIWLAGQCAEKGILGKEFQINAEPVPGLVSEDGQLQAYRLVITKMRQVPVTILTEPKGASVLFNGKPAGVTPLLDVKVNQEPYTIEIKLAGHTLLRRSGLDPQGLHLSVQLERDKSVVYQSKWTNSLGMNLEPLNSNTLVQTTEVSRKDFMQFVREAKGVNPPPPPGFEQEQNHPVVNVTRQEAEQFAKWLTEKEQALELIDKSDTYRLPTDEEWSLMAGISGEQGDSPYDRSIHSLSEAPIYYWGYDWPPKPETGNFADQDALIYLPPNKVIVGYSDGSPYTSPVGRFPANALGLFDIDGNVQEWIGEPYGGDDQFEFRAYDVARGANYLSFKPSHMNPSIRTPLPQNSRDPGIGFRLVLAREPKPAGMKEAPANLDH